jgi:hypothetical protein
MAIPDPSQSQLMVLPGNRDASLQYMYLGYKLHRLKIKSTTKTGRRLIFLICELEGCDYELALYESKTDVSRNKLSMLCLPKFNHIQFSGICRIPADVSTQPSSSSRSLHHRANQGSDEATGGR